MLTISRKVRGRVLVQQASSTSTNIPQRQHGHSDTSAHTQEDHLDRKTLIFSQTFVLFSKSELQNLKFLPSSHSLKDPESSAYSDQFIMPPNTLSAQDQGTHLLSSLRQDQHHQAILLQYIPKREQYNSYGPEFLLHMRYGSSILPDPSLPGPIVQDREAAPIIYCIGCRAVLKVLGHCQNSCRSAAIKVLRSNNAVFYSPE